MQAPLEAGADAPIDSYVDWCEAGPPSLAVDGGCYDYYSVPCGLPTGDTVDDGGLVSRCDQICPGAPDDVCAVLPPVWIDELLDAGLLDAATAGTVDAGGVLVLCECVGSSGRRPRGLRRATVRGAGLGAYFTRAGHLEHASVAAFVRMRAELTALRAPRRLVEEAERAIADERRHARMVARLARRFGGHRVRARVDAVPPRDAEAIAMENAVEGCVRETFGALVAAWQARHATDAGVRRVMRALAADEARHAALSLAVDAFLSSRLPPRSRARVARAARAAVAKLRHDTARVAPRDWFPLAGLPDATQSKRLLAALSDHVWKT